ncbi:MAG: glycosyltransferase family 1 protein [Bacteroidales bacterium]
MSDNHLHIIAFDIPYPPNYGGVIDVWHKIRTLHAHGIKTLLHCFEYQGRERSNKLNEYCEAVYYYPRKTGLRQAVSGKPYIIISRKSELLMERLLKDDHPILFEGLHSCYYLTDKRLKGRPLIYREANIEHHYYYHLFKTAANLYLKTYYLVESLKLKLFEKNIRHATAVAAVSDADKRYLESRYPQTRVILLPCFHANEELSSSSGKGDYILYHGNLEVPENENAAIFLLKKVFPGFRYRLVIAGMNPRQRLKRETEKLDNVSLLPNPSQKKMQQLVRDAHINLLVTFQATGLKLKLLNALYQGRFALVNDQMVKGTYLKELCHIANTPEEIKETLHKLFEQSFNESHRKSREQVLDQYYANHTNADKLTALLYRPK